MATSFNLEPQPELAPVLDGNKVVFSREQALKDAAAAKANKASDDNSAPTTDAKSGRAK